SAATTREDLETVFSRRTTSLYFHGAADDPIDPSSLGHVGAPVGIVKRVSKDREGRSWLRFHTSRALERHDGLQFGVAAEKPFGFGISEMRLAISRKPEFEVPAGSDVEVLVPEDRLADLPPLDGATVYCSASNAVKRRFPVPSFRPSDVIAGTPVDVTATLAPDGISLQSGAAVVRVAASLPPAKNPQSTETAVVKALSRMGGTDWSLGNLTLVDPDRLFAPASILNDARRRLVERLDETRAAAHKQKVELALVVNLPSAIPTRPDFDIVLKQRLDQPPPEDAARYGEIVLALGRRTGREAEAALAPFAGMPLRIALPVFTHERDVNGMRTAVKHLLRAGFAKWEASDLATLRILRQAGVEDVTADWTLYAFNRAAIAQLAELGVRRAVASPENGRDNLHFLASSPFPVECLEAQTTPLFISLTKPAAEDGGILTDAKGEQFATFRLDGLWVTARPSPRRFTPPPDAMRRVDRSWDVA
ncbi:MAG: DUF3656 domain-containing protein, partial [Kiritimatiellae bacterium]|nr:DUF3656 domain-containing protein [Kiritimatiellia bacterium]